MLARSPLPFLFGLKDLARRIRPIPFTTKIAGNSTNTAPFPVRLALVGTTVGLTTPLLAILGGGRLWWSYLPQSSVGLFSKYTIGLLIGGGGATVIYNYLIPFVRDHSDFLLPFSVANSITSMVWYGIGESIWGMEVMLGSVSIESLRNNLPKFLESFLLPIGRTIPIAGAAVGVLTTLTAPLLWISCFKLCWSKELQQALLENNPAWPLDLYSYFIIPVGLPIGLVAGTSLHLLLSPIIQSPVHIPWTHRALPILSLLTLSGIVYFGLNRPVIEDFLWIKRKNIQNGDLYSMNVKTSEKASGSSQADHSRLKRKIIAIVHVIRQPIPFFFGTIMTSVPKKPQHLEENIIQIHSMNDRTILYELIDDLIQYKYHQNNLQPSRKISSSLGLSEFGLKLFFKHIEELVAIERKIKNIQNNEKNIDDKFKIYLYELKQNIYNEICHDFDIKTSIYDIIYTLEDNDMISRRNYAIGILLQNLQLFEKELQLQLEYKIPDINDEVVIANYNRLHRFDSSYISFALLSIPWILGYLLG